METLGPPYLPLAAALGPVSRLPNPAAGPGRGQGGAGDRGELEPQVRKEMTSLGRGDWGVPLPFSAMHTRFPKPDLWRLRSRPSCYQPVLQFLKGPRRPAGSGERGWRREEKRRLLGVRERVQVWTQDWGLVAKGRLRGGEES